MGRRFTWLAVVWVVACAGRGERDPVGPPGTEEPPAPTSPPEPTPPEPTGPLALSAVSAALDDDIASIVVVSWSQNGAADVHLEFSVDPGVWVNSPVRQLAGGAHQELLLGVPFDATVTWRIVADDGTHVATTDDADTATGSPPLQPPTLTIGASDPARMDLAGAPFLFTTLSSTNQWYDPWLALIYDRQGRVVWAKRSPPQRVMMHSRVARDGHSLYLDYNSYWYLFDGGDAAEIAQFQIDGTELRRIATPGMHHAFTDLPDGTLAYGGVAQSYGNEWLMKVFVDDTTEVLWDCEAWLADLGEGGFCSSNTLTYNEPSDAFLFSFWSLETIVEVDGTTGAVDRYFGHVDGAYAFDPPESAFWWQHGGIVTDAGTLLTSTDLTAGGVETIAREYTFDDANRTLRSLWSFGIGDGIFGEEMGEAVRLPNGNTWHNYGELARLREATPEGDVVWDLTWQSEAIGRSMPVVDLYALAGPRL